jgi:two-component system chemotaxis response regulator CheY
MAKKILVVDDSVTVRQQVSSVLEQAGYMVAEAEDGQAGAEAIEGADDISMVICDVNMPRMNGLEMVGRVKKDGARSGLPIVMLTTEGDPSLIAKAKQLGAKGWMVKPFKADHLLAAVQKLTA